MRYKKADGEINYIIFLAVFIIMLGILNSYFISDVVVITEDKPEQTLFETLFNLPQAIGSWVAEKFVYNIPILGDFFNLIRTNVDFDNIHPYLALILGAFVTVPLGYILLRLYKGGG